MKLTTKVMLAATAAAAGLCLGASAASAEIVCNSENQCWHAHRHYNYQPGWGIAVHPDNWRWGSTEQYTWREHRGRGYWRNGAWVKF
jgi:hypothetical protein